MLYGPMNLQRIVKNDVQTHGEQSKERRIHRNMPLARFIRGERAMLIAYFSVVILT